MAKPKLTYFDFPGGRGEDCRMAFFVAGVDFEDHRIKGPEWRELKNHTPFGQLPTLELEGKPILAQSNAVLAYIGVEHGLLPKDPWELARHLAVLAAVEDLRAMVEATGGVTDEDAKKAARKELAAGPLQTWAQNIERQIDGPFVAGPTLQVTDLKLFTAMRWIKGGIIDHLPTDTLDSYAKLGTLFSSVAKHPKVAEWRARFD